MVYVQLVLIAMCSYQLYAHYLNAVQEKIIDFAFFNLPKNKQNSIGKYLCGYNSTAKCCSCEESCRFHGTCCIDAFLNCNETSFERYIESFQKKIGKAKDIERSQIIDIYGSYDVDLSFIVMKCQNTNSLYFAQCNKNLDKNEYKVRVKGPDDVIYRNKFCALCHNVTNYTYLTYMFHGCRANSYNSLSERNYRCRLSIFNQTVKFKLHQSTIGSIKTLKDNFNSHLSYCNDSGESLCQNSYLALGKVDYGPYLLNPYCAKCLNKTQIFSSDGCEQEFTKVESIISLKAPINPQIIISFDDVGNPVLQYKTSFRFCKDGYQYDLFRDRCIKSYYTHQQKGQSNKRYQLIQEIYETMVNYSFPFVKQEAKDSLLDRYFCVYQSSSKSCSCSKYCNLNGTCCIDAFFDENFDSFAEYLDYFQQKAAIKNYMTVLPVIENKQLLFSETSDGRNCDVEEVQTFAKCVNVNSEYFKMCNDTKNNDTEYAIRVKGADGIIYRNKYCALCNNVTTYEDVQYKVDYCREYKILNIHKHLDNNKNGTNTISNYKYCKIGISMMKPIDFDTSKFLRGVYYPSKTEMNCSSYEKYMCLNSFLGIVHISKGRNRGNLPNSICAKCLHENVYSKNYARPVMYPLTETKFTIHSLKFLKYPVRIQPDLYPSFKIICPDGFIFDKQFDSCVPAIRRIRTYGSFRLGTLGITWDTLNIQSKTLHCLFKLNGSLWYLNQNLGDFLPKIPPKNSTLKEKDYEKQTYKAIKIPSDNFEEINNVIRVIKTKNNSKIYASFQGDNFLARLYGFEPQMFYVPNRVCTSTRVIENYDLTQTCNVIYNNTIFNITENVTYWTEIIHNNGTTTRAAFCTKFLRLPNCTLTKIDKSLINIIGSKVYIKNRKGYNLLRVGQYFPLPDGLAICISTLDKDKYRWYKTLEKSEKTASIICLCLSFVMETILITTYVKLNEYRTIHGKNMLSLCFSLLICDLMMICFFISTDIPQKVCQFTAAILHFFALALSFWAAVMAFDLWSKFNNLFSASNSTSLFLKYNLIGWGIPLLAILVCFILENLSNEVIGYGKNGQCFVTNPLAKLFSYVLPTIIVMAISIALLLFMIRKLRRDLQSRYKVSTVNTTSPNLINMSVKLCLALGIAELLGIIQIPFSHENELYVIINSVFGFFYTLVRSLRGFFIFVSFMTTRKMKKHFRRFMKCERYSNKESLQLPTLSKNTNPRLIEEAKT